jgi:hypothetical protein
MGVSTRAQPAARVCRMLVSTTGTTPPFHEFQKPVPYEIVAGKAA